MTSRTRGAARYEGASESLGEEQSLGTVTGTGRASFIGGGPRDRRNEELSDSRDGPARESDGGLGARLAASAGGGCRWDPLGPAGRVGGGRAGGGLATGAVPRSSAAQ